MSMGQTARGGAPGDKVAGDKVAGDKMVGEGAAGHDAAGRDTARSKPAKGRSAKGGVVKGGVVKGGADMAGGAAGKTAGAGAKGRKRGESVSEAELFARLKALNKEQKDKLVRSLTSREVREYDARWSFWAHEGQKAPPGDWRVWLIRAGRGFGKTRAGAEWVAQVARDNPKGRIALVGATVEDVERVMIEGASGLIAVTHDEDKVLWRRDAGEVRFGSGAVAQVYSAACPEKLRGPEHHAAWCDELAKWRYGDAAWDNLMMGLRLGDNPQVLVTTTPKPINLMRRVMALPGLIETNGRTDQNPNLPETFVAAMQAEYGASRLGRQELDGELIEDVVGALWSRAMIETCRVRVTPDLARVVVAVDPPAGLDGDACGIVCVALGVDGRGYVIEDASVSGASPERWAQAVAACAARHGADRVVAEKNQGGEMVRSVLMAADAVLPLTLVHASHAKVVRAEPVAALYEAGRVSHVGGFAALEDEMCGMIVGGSYQGPGRSPDRADALVWGLSELMLRGARRASLRTM